MVESRTIHGVELITQGDMVVRHMQQLGEFEPESMAAWVAACKHGSWVIDVGAYTGIYAIAAMQAGAKPIAVEPNPAAVKRLIENARANRAEVIIHQVAAGCEAGEQILYMRSPLSSANSMREQLGEHLGVLVVPLDDLAPTGPVTAIKIDAEHFECEVLRGARGLIKAWRPLVITEALTDADRDDQAKVMVEYGYFNCTPADSRNLIWRWTDEGTQ